MLKYLNLINIIELMWIKCLKCGHTTYARSDKIDKARRCSECYSTYVMPEQYYEEMVTAIMPMVSDTTPIRDILNTLITLSQKQGVFVRPIESWQIAEDLVKEAERRKEESKDRMRK